MGKLIRAGQALGARVKSPVTPWFAGESACATSRDQQFTAASGAGFSLPGLFDTGC